MAHDIDETPETPESQEMSESQDTESAKLGTSGMHAIQGIPRESTAPENEMPLKLDESQMEPLVTESDREREYRLESPHKDYEFYKGVLEAERRADLGRDAATADGLNDAVSATLQANQDAKDGASKFEQQMDSWIEHKYGRTPYTEDADPPDPMIEDAEAKKD